MVECENCGVGTYRYYTDDEPPQKVDIPCMVFTSYNSQWLCVYCGRTLDYETKEVINEGNADIKGYAKRVLSEHKES